jgi:AcrR family transcriptional regulator
MEVQLSDLVEVPSEAQVQAAQARRDQRKQRQQAVGEVRRALVLEAARSVFEELGLEGASIREIAKRAGYTPGALYSYFESKEAIYGALLEASLVRLQEAVDQAKAVKNNPAKTLAVKARAWFNFFFQNPRDLDLGFYLVHGMAPRGLTAELNQQLNDQLLAALQPCEDAMLALGLDAAAARQENAALFAHGVGVLLLHHTRRIKLFAQQPEALFELYLNHLIARLAPQVAQAQASAKAAVDQADLFGR